MKKTSPPCGSIRRIPRKGLAERATLAFLLVGASLILNLSSLYAGGLDPFFTGSLVASSQANSLNKNLMTAACVFDDASKAPLSLSDVVERALCNNPQTRVAWLNARIQAAQVGAAESSYLPTINITGSTNQNTLQASSTANTAVSYNTQNATASASYLLFNFGGRESNIENARQVLIALNFTQDATLQTVFLLALQSYYQLLANQGAVNAAKEAEISALESLNAATARYSIGVATPADKLQAQTAYSQAVLNRIQAEGNANISTGVLANSMGLDANQPITLAPLPNQPPIEQFEKDVTQLITEARRQRPDLFASEAQIRAARANLNSVRASGLPSFSLSASYGFNNNSLYITSTQSTAYGLSATIPIFTGFSTTYRIRAAEEQVENQMAQHELLSQQVALDVWKGYQALVTDTEAVKSSADLLASATQSEAMARGRYKAGVGSILDLLTAQTALASAQQQNILAIYNWYIAKATLAQSLGQLDFSILRASDEKNLPDNGSKGTQ